MEVRMTLEAIASRGTDSAAFGVTIDSKDYAVVITRTALDLLDPLGGSFEEKKTRLQIVLRRQSWRSLVRLIATQSFWTLETFSRAVAMAMTFSSQSLPAGANLHAVSWAQNF